MVGTSNLGVWNGHWQQCVYFLFFSSVFWHPNDTILPVPWQDVWAELKYEPREGSEEQERWSKATETIDIKNGDLLTISVDQMPHNFIFTV